MSMCVSGPMKERPISFNGEMVRAILEGRKTQTRRPIYCDPDLTLVGPCHYTPKIVRDGEEIPGVERIGCFDDSGEFGALCPFGEPGDLLWVRESALVTRIASNTVFFSYGGESEWHCVDIPSRIKGLREDRRMPNGCFKEAARIWLRIKRVWIERIQEITEADAKAEGVLSYPHEWECMDYPYPSIAYQATKDSEFRYTCPKQAFEDLWDSIYGKKEFAWGKNPWGWCCEFERVERD